MPHLGRCRIDDAPAHGGYHCGRHVAKAVTPESVGLTAPEIAWLRANPKSNIARDLAELYRHLQNEPHDEKARQNFADHLDGWRQQMAPRPQRSRA